MKALLFSMFLLCPGLAMASPPSAESVRARLAGQYPGTRIDAVQATPIAGLYEVALGHKIVYVDPTGRYFVFGRIFDLPGNRDLTEERLREIARIDVTRIPADQWLEQGEGNRILYVFSDPACGHCQRLEQTLAGLPALRVRTLMLPLQPGSRELARDIWCAADRARAWRAWMRDQVRPAKVAECDAGALDRNLDLARDLGIHATPALLSEDGRVSLGALEAAALSAWLSGLPADTAAAHKESR